MTHTTIIGLTGPAGAGKDTVADWLCSQYGFAKAAFAAGPRVMLEALCAHTGVDHAHLFEPGLKERDMPVLQASYRRAMQTLGTEWGRLQMDMGLWVRVLEAHLGISHGTPAHDRIVVTDVRYPNEADAVERWGGVLVGVSRPKAMAVRAHSSEQHIGTLWGRCHEVLKNEGSVQYLHSIVDDFCQRMVIEPRPCGDLWEELNA